MRINQKETQTYLIFMRSNIIFDKLVSTISKFIELIALLSPIYQSLSEKNITTSDSKIYYPAGTS